jgi:DNA-binding Lrp family transcriptional regulator
MAGGDDHLDAHDDVDDPVEVGVELLSKLEFESLSVAAAIDRLETVTTHPRTTREILEEAERRGVIEREGGDVQPRGGGYVSFQSDVVTKDGEFSCRRCGATISTGYFINFESGELGAFGSSCIRKVTGRE